MRTDQTAELWRDCVGISLSIPGRPKIAALWRISRSFSRRSALNGTQTGRNRLFSAGQPRRSEMTKVKLFAAVAVLSVAAIAPSLAEAHYYRHHHHHHWPLPYPISYLHNYGPGLQPGTFAYYDGPSTNHCAQSSAAYLGQDRRRHPCF